MLPPMLSFAQNGEDVVLRRAFLGQESGFYVDVGACDPVEDSVTLHFYEQGWHGVNLEPDARLHAALCAARPRDITLHAAVGPAQHQVEFFPTGTRGHGTLDPGIAAGRTPAPVQMVEQIPLARLLAEHAAGREIDFLKVDVEGFEAAVLGSADFHTLRPRVILVEAVDAEGRPTHATWEGMLFEAGYRFALFDGLNRFYCREEEAEVLLPRLAAPANVLDNYRLAREARTQAEKAELAQQFDRAMAEVQQLRPLRGELAALREQLQASQAATEAEQRDHAETRTALEMAQRQLVSCQEELAACQGELTTCQAAAQQETATLTSALEAERQAHAAVRTAMTTSQQELAATRGALLAEQQHGEQLQVALAAVHASTSWRITEPVRNAGRLARLLRRGGS